MLTTPEIIYTTLSLIALGFVIHRLLKVFGSKFKANIEIILDKEKYFSGEEMTGKFFITPKKDFKINSLKLMIQGYTWSGSGKSRRKNIIYSQDLELFQAINAKKGEKLDSNFKFKLPYRESLENNPENWELSVYADVEGIDIEDDRKINIGLLKSEKEALLLNIEKEKQYNTNTLIITLSIVFLFLALIYYTLRSIAIPLEKNIMNIIMGISLIILTIITKTIITKYLIKEKNPYFTREETIKIINENSSLKPYTLKPAFTTTEARLVFITLIIAYILLAFFYFLQRK